MRHDSLVLFGRSAARAARSAAWTRLDPADGDTLDAAIRTRVLANLQHEPTWQPSVCNVFVLDGVVTFQGLTRRDADRPQALAAAHGVPGVRAVHDARVRRREWQGMV